MRCVMRRRPPSELARRVRWGRRRVRGHRWRRGRERRERHGRWRGAHEPTRSATAQRVEPDARPPVPRPAWHCRPAVAAAPSVLVVGAAAVARLARSGAGPQAEVGDVLDAHFRAAQVEAAALVRRVVAAHAVVHAVLGGDAFEARRQTHLRACAVVFDVVRVLESLRLARPIQMCWCGLAIAPLVRGPAATSEIGHQGILAGLTRGHSLIPRRAARPARRIGRRAWRGEESAHVDRPQRDQRGQAQRDNHARGARSPAGTHHARAQISRPPRQQLFERSTTRVSALKLGSSPPPPAVRSRAGQLTRLELSPFYRSSLLSADAVLPIWADPNSHSHHRFFGRDLTSLGFFRPWPTVGSFPARPFACFPERPKCASKS